MYLAKILIIFLLAFSANAAMLLKTTKFECAPSPKYFENYTCHLKPINRYKTLAYMKTYIKTILRNVSINVGLYSRNDANIYKPFLVNFTSNICKYMDKKVSGLYINTVMNVIRSYTNVNHPCPYTGYLIAHDLHIDTKLFSLPTPPKNSYKFVFLFYEGYPLDYIGKVIFYVDLIPIKD